MSTAGKCPSCHRTLEVPARFCYRCGTWLQTMDNAAVLASPPPSAGEGRPCPRCRYPVLARSNFCANCGYRCNPEPLSRRETKPRRQATAAARRTRRTPEEADTATVRWGWAAIVVCVLLLAADLYFVVTDPAHAAFLGPLAVLLVLHAPLWVSRFNQARRRQRARRHGATPTKLAPPARTGPKAG